LDRLADLLGLPSGLAETLRASAAPADIPGSELIEETTARSAVVGTMRSDWAKGYRLLRSRPLYIAYAVGILWASLGCLAMTALGIAVLLTDGSAADQAGVTTEDRVFVGIFALLTIVLARKPRPALVVQEDRFDATESVTVVPFTSTAVDAPLLRVPVTAGEAKGLGQDSSLMVDKITTVRRSNVGTVLGRLEATTLVEFERRLLVFLGFGT
jgi:mRNA interferase MazF